MAQPLSLQNALQQPLFTNNMQLIPTNPSTKALPNFFVGFLSQTSPVDTRHPFLTAQANSFTLALPLQATNQLMTKQNVQTACETMLIQWIEACIPVIGGRYRPIKALRNSRCLPRILAQHQLQLPDIRVDFTFIYGDRLEEECVAAVLQTKAVGSINIPFWQGEESDRTTDDKMAKEARA